ENAPETCHSLTSFHYSSMGRGRPSVNFFGTLAFLSVCAAAARPAAAAGRERFTVAPFVNEGGRRTLDHLQAGLPAIIADRLAMHPGLRFAGPAALVERSRLDETLARADAGGVRYVVTGSYDRRPDWKIRVVVDV